jgi:TonB family protein
MPIPECQLLSRRIAIALLLALTLLPIRSAGADNNNLEKQLNFDYLEKVLTLRHFYSGKQLRFHADGTLSADAPVGPWTIDGQIEIQKIELRGALLVVEARRIHRIFDTQLKPLDQLTALNDSHEKSQTDLEKDLKKDLQRLKVKIEIELPNDKPDEKDVSSAIHAVFLLSTESMMEIVPAYWRAYFAKQEGIPAAQVKGTVTAFRPGGGISPPHAISSPDPGYSDEARKARYMGTVVTSLVVDAAGMPTDVQIVRPLGLGLDEKAVDAINRWKFKPAEKDGEPVAAAIHIEVNFHLY